MTGSHPARSNVTREVDGKHLGVIVADMYFPKEMVNVGDADGFKLGGTPFGVMRAQDLRAWAAAFNAAADRLEQAP